MVHFPECNNPLQNGSRYAQQKIATPLPITPKVQ